jgi:hypothetical protein
LLRAWLGRAPDDGLRARLAPIRALTRLYYAGVLLSASATMPRTEPDADLAAPACDAFLRDVRGASRTPQAVHTLGKVYLAAFLSGAAVPPLDSI